MFLLRLIWEKLNFQPFGLEIVALDRLFFCSVLALPAGFFTETINYAAFNIRTIVIGLLLQERKYEYLAVRDRVLSTRYPKRNQSSYEAPKKRRRGRVKSVTRQEAEQKAAAENEKWEHEHGLKVADIYAFTGMHHIFTQHSKAVTRVAFAHNEKGLLAMASVDGIISVGNVFDSDPNRSLKILRDHIMAVTDVSWSHSNTMLASCSLDGHLRVWNPHSAVCAQSIDLGAPALCCSFLPGSDEWILCGDKSGALHLAGASTGQIALHVTLQGTVTAIGFRPGQPVLAFVGCATGDLYSVSLLPQGAACSMDVVDHVKLGNTSITSLLYRAQLTEDWSMPSLLISQIRSPTRLYQVTQPDPTTPKQQLELYAEFPPAPKKSFVRSTMCPLIPSRNNVCLVAGSESGTVYIYGVRPPYKQAAAHKLPVGWMVNQFAGHAGVIYDVQWNCDESLLASSDQDGMVIIWKRVSVKSPTSNFTTGPSQSLTKATHVTSPGAYKKRPPPGYAGSPSRRDLVENPLHASSSQATTPSRQVSVSRPVNSPTVAGSPSRLPVAATAKGLPRATTLPPPGTKQPVARLPGPSQPPLRSTVASQTMPHPINPPAALSGSSSSSLGIPRVSNSQPPTPSRTPPPPSSSGDQQEDIL